MKVIENKETSIKLNEEQNVHYSDLIATVINKPLKESMSLMEMRKDLKILEVLEKAKETIEFEDVDLSYIKDAVNKSTWVIRHKDILDFADYIESL